MLNETFSTNDETFSTRAERRAQAKREDDLAKIKAVIEYLDSIPVDETERYRSSQHLAIKVGTLAREMNRIISESTDLLNLARQGRISVHPKFPPQWAKDLEMCEDIKLPRETPIDETRRLNGTAIRDNDGALVLYTPTTHSLLVQTVGDMAASLGTTPKARTLISQAEERLKQVEHYRQAREIDLQTAIRERDEAMVEQKENRLLINQMVQNVNQMVSKLLALEPKTNENVITPAFRSK